MDITKDYYSFMGLDTSADLDIIKAVYRVLVKKYHPDVFKGDKIEAGGLSLLCRCRDMLMADDDRKAIGEFGDRPVIGFWACEEPKDQRRPLDAFLC